MRVCGHFLQPALRQLSECLLANSYKKDASPSGSPATAGPKEDPLTDEDILWFWATYFFLSSCAGQDCGVSEAYLLVRQIEAEAMCPKCAPPTFLVSQQLMPEDMFRHMYVHGSVSYTR
jgi:hypothetical protein